LSDGVTIRFNDWRAAVKRKWKANADHYSSEELRFAHLISLVEGEALENLSPMISDDHPDPLETTDAVFAFLDEIYNDPNRVAKAKNEFRELRMQPKQDFHKFHTEFIRLANLAQVPSSEWRYEFNHRLTPRLRSAAVGAFISDSCDFKFFVNVVGKIALQQTEIDNSRAALDKTKNKSTGKNNDKGNNNSGSGSGSSKRPTDRQEKVKTNTTREERDKLQKENKCFICKGEGHIARNCPQKETLSVKEIERGRTASRSPSAQPRVRTLSPTASEN
jgi:hypothetical protein